MYTTCSETLLQKHSAGRRTVTPRDDDGGEDDMVDLTL